MKNKVAATFLFTLLVVVGLMALYDVPVIYVDGTPLRRIDVLSDLRPNPVEEPVDSDSIVLPKPVKPVFVDSCKAGLVCIDNYAEADPQAMDAFYAALSHRRSLGRPVRIAYFGDSFIEGDILTGDLRAMLQTKFGGCGVGYVDVTSVVAGFRNTVHHTFSGWSSHASTDKAGFDRSKQDLSNHYFIPHAGASVTLQGTSHVAHLDSCQTSSFYFYSPDSVRISAMVNGAEHQAFHLEGDSSAVRMVTVKGNIHSVNWQVDSLTHSMRCFAATMDGKEGIQLDNFSLRGSSGKQLQQVPMSVLKAYNRLRTYDLIVLQYGLNVAEHGVKDYSYYIGSMEQVVAHLKSAFPQASILVIGVGDREQRSETGELHTMPEVKSLIRYQQLLAARSQVAFWNMFEAMGGEGSIVEMANSRPPMANYDYTHINFRGGKKIAKLLYDAMIYGWEQYERRKAYEE